VSTYLGLDILEERPDHGEGVEEDQEQRFRLLDPGTGARSVVSMDASPSLHRRHRWVCSSRAEAGVLRSFMDARKGRAVPFWYPSRVRDVLQRTTIGGATTDIVIEAVGYASVFGIGNARRHFAFLRRGAAPWYGKATAAVDNLDGTETISFGGVIGQPGAPEDVVVSFLLLMRLEADEIEIEWRGRQSARATLPMVEIGGEAP
jgi:hypothetical protein